MNSSDVARERKTTVAVAIRSGARPRGAPLRDRERWFHSVAARRTSWLLMANSTCPPAVYLDVVDSRYRTPRHSHLFRETSPYRPTLYSCWVTMTFARLLSIRARTRPKIKYSVVNINAMTWHAITCSATWTFQIYNGFWYHTFVSSKEYTIIFSQRNTQECQSLMGARRNFSNGGRKGNTY